MGLRILTLLFLALFISACGSNEHKAEEIDTSMENSKTVSGDQKVGVKDGNMVYQKKVVMAEELRRLQNEVYTTEDKVYGNRKYGSKGLYGVLKTCRMNLSVKKNGGDGKLKWIEPIDRVSDKEEEYQLGLDENKELVGVSEEFLKDRITRFRKYKMILNKREDEYTEKIDICKAELKARKFDMEKRREELGDAS